MLDQPFPRDHPPWEPCPTLAWGLWSSGGCTYEWPKHTATPGVSAAPAPISTWHPVLHSQRESQGGREGVEGTGIPEASAQTGHTLPTATPRRQLHAVPLLHKRLREGWCLACGHTAHRRRLRGLTLSLAGSDVPAPTRSLQGHAVPPLCPHQSEVRTNWVQNNRDPDR